MPSDARTLLQIPRTVTNKRIVKPGEYVLFGLLTSVEKLIAQYELCNHLESIEICVNIDCLAISKSSSSQFYPILCSLFENRDFIEIVGIYHGYAKPADPNEFLKEFVDEAIHCVNNGIVYNKFYSFKIKAFIFDVPAKAFCTCTGGHSGYSSCSKCNIRGIYCDNRICFPTLDNLAQRTDHDFRTKRDPDHQS